MTRQFLFSGFGGQGILFAGKFVAYKGLMDGKNVSWLPSYGPEMRGGTASCGVIVGDETVGSPIVSTPDVLVAMNLPSLDKYESTVAPGGIIFVDSTLVSRPVNRTDVTVYAIPATQMASDNGTPTLANMILVGKILKVLNDFEDDSVRAALGKVVSAKRADMLEVNLNAMKLGADY
ncbi:MAG: 2-oxoacid:acceptor oxidoreductase family protein [Clostridia bacterium]|nr:2-oxoacid:acceptor oxidoreductase family protein [Clostridia bacterium]MBQ2272032.1 2-oxoacid:acceptor oxidoreductase family protein [Clostridia bacterium]MBQ5819659.1 2-oxoacid:acceptor oxidoreductase family protein [Clostridia bacterium]